MPDDLELADTIDEANPPDEQVDDYPDDAEQNAPEGAVVDVPEPDTPEKGDTV